MKGITSCIVLVALSLVSYAQENKLTLSGGYVFGSLEESDVNSSGWRVNGLFELLPIGEKVTHGFGIGYIGTTAESNFVSYTINSLPIYYAPKFTFGEKSLKGYIRGDFGWQFSRINREGTAVTDLDKDNGFYLGIGAGAVKDVNEKISINLEYNFNYLYNSFYRDGFLNSITLGVGYSF